MNKDVELIYKDFMEQRNKVRNLCGYEEKQEGQEEVFPERKVFRLKKGRVLDLATNKIYSPKQLPEFFSKGTKVKYLTACLIQFLK